MTEQELEIAQLRGRIEFLEGLVRAREKKITELGSMLHGRGPKAPSRFKRGLISLWDALPRGIQRGIEPFADFIDRVVK